MAKLLRCGVIGMGHFGSYHAEKYRSIPGCELVGIADNHANKLAAAADKFSVPSYSDYIELLKQPIDAVSIATPTQSHYQIAKDCLQRKIPILLEKPMTRTLDEATALIELAEQQQTILQVGYIERFNPIINQLRPKLQNPQYISIERHTTYNDRSLDVSVIFDLMIHDTDLLLSLVPSPIKTIHVKGLKVFSKDFDIIHAHILFKNDCMASISESRISRKSNRQLRFFQTNGYYSIDLQNYKAEHLSPAPDGTSQLTIDQHSVLKHETDALEREIQHFLDCVRDGTEPLVSGKVGYEAMEVSMGIQDALISDLSDANTAAAVVNF